MFAIRVVPSSKATAAVSAAAAGAAYLVYKLLAAETQKRGDSGEAEERREPEPQQHPHAVDLAAPSCIMERGPTGKSRALM